MIRNPVFTADGRIDCEINHPVYGWIPFTADPSDVAAHGRAIFAMASEMNPAAYVEPEPQNIVPQEVSRFQARAALLQTGLLETADLAVAASGDPFLQLAWKEATTFPRTSPGIAALAPALGLTDDDLDDLFRAAALITA